MKFASKKKKAEKFYITICRHLAFAYYHLMCITARVKIINFNNIQESAVYALWHGWFYTLLCLPMHVRNRTSILISPSNDGEIIAFTAENSGFPLIRGSQKRRGARAVRTIVKTLKSDLSVAYTVDGPKGPLHKVKIGIIQIARMSQKPIIPLVDYCNPKITIPSWDKLSLPFFFAKHLVIVGDPVYIPRDADEEIMEEYRQKLENTMHELYARAKEEYHAKKKKLEKE